MAWTKTARLSMWLQSHKSVTAKSSLWLQSHEKAGAFLQQTNYSNYSTRMIVVCAEPIKPYYGGISVRGLVFNACDCM